MSLLDRFFGKPSKTKFAKAMIAALKAAGDQRELVYEAAEDRLVERGGSGTLNLANLYIEHSALPRGERQAHLNQIAESFVTAAEELPEDFGQVRDHLRPKIWSRAAINHIELRARLQGESGPDIPVYPLGEHLYSSLVYDLPHSMRSLTNEQLETWGVSYYEALEAACHNLDEATVAWAQIGEHFHSSVSGDNYDSSRVLLADKLRSLDTVGDPVAIIPNRDTLLVAGAEDEDSLKVMLEMTKQTLAQEPRPLAPVPLRLTDGSWESWLPPPGHPLHEEFRQLETEFLGELYHEQKELLDQIHEQEMEDVFVATFSGIKRPDDPYVSTYCVWGENVHALLPRTHYIFCVNDDGVAASAPWEQVMAAAGDLVTAEESYYPRRYRVREFPSPPQLARIGVAEEFEQ